MDNYFSIKKYYDDYYKLTFHKTLLRNSLFEYDLSPKFERNKNNHKLENNLSRARSKIFEYSLCNDFDYFVTFTLNKEKYNRFDLDVFIGDLSQFIRNYRKKHSMDIQYLLIPENHENGAWHMHGLIKGDILKDLRLFTLNDRLPYKLLEMIKEGRDIYSWISYSNKFGYSTLEKVKSRIAVSKYITKYITKDFLSERGVLELNKKLYYVSRGLLSAEKINEGHLTSSHLEKITFTYENDYIKSLELNKCEYFKLIDLLNS